MMAVNLRLTQLCAAIGALDRLYPQIAESMIRHRGLLSFAVSATSSPPVPEPGNRRCRVVSALGIAAGAAAGRVG